MVRRLEEEGRERETPGIERDKRTQRHYSRSVIDEGPATSGERNSATKYVTQETRPEPPSDSLGRIAGIAAHAREKVRLTDARIRERRGHRGQKAAARQVQSPERRKREESRAAPALAMIKAGKSSSREQEI